MDIKVYQKCYKMRKGFGNVPQKVTITKVDGDNVTFVWGHRDEKDFEYTVGLMGGTCKVEKILIDIREEQKQILKKEDEILKRRIAKAQKSLDEFRAGIRYDN